MSKILVIAEHHDGKLNAATAKTVSAAAAISGASIDVLVLAADPAAVAAEAAKIAGVAKVLTVANAANAQAIAQVLAPQIAQLAKGYTHVFGPSTTFGKDLMPCVAALLGVNQVSDLMTVEGSHTFKRPIYAGNAIITVEAPADQIVVATVRAASWPEAAQGGSAAVEPPASMRPCLRTPASSAWPPVPATARTCRAPSAWSPVAVASVRKRTSRSSSSWPTSSVLPSVPRVRRSMPVTCPATCRSARPARSSRRNCTWPSASAVPSSI